MPTRIVAAAAILFVTSVAQAADTTADEASKKLIGARAVEAVIWGMPAVNYDLMRQEVFRIGGKENQVVYWSRPLDGNNQTLTPNPDSIYLMAFYNTKDVGPLVIEIPPAGDDGSTRRRASRPARLRTWSPRACSRRSRRRRSIASVARPLGSARRRVRRRERRTGAS
jgi:Protein of unknown function (DUF1254)